MSRYSKREVSTEELDVGQQPSIILPPTGSIADVIRAENHEIDVVDGPSIDRDYMAQLAFNEEPVTIRINTTTSKTDASVPAVYVNGRSQFFIRGVPITVRRKFVEGLARAKTMMVETVQNNNVDGGMIARTSQLRYDFTLIEDKNPRAGHEWLQKLLAEA